jgi:small subunit ribosomal protein S6
MREYETVYILDPALTDADVQHSLDKVGETIKRHSGVIFRSQNMGKKTLAYRVKKQSKGYYVAFDYTGDNKLVSEMERAFRLDERVLRYLTVKLDDEVNVDQRKQQLADEAEALAKAMAAQQAAAVQAPEAVLTEEVNNA